MMLTSIAEKRRGLPEEKRPNVATTYSMRSIKSIDEREHQKERGKSLRGGGE